MLQLKKLFLKVSQIEQINRYWQRILFWLLYAAMFGSVGYIIWMFVENGRAMEANPDTQSNLGWFLLAYLFLLSILIGALSILFLIKWIPNDNIWKTVALFIFTILPIGALVWLFL